MKKIIFTISLIISLSILKAGRYAGDFIEIGTGVRALGMGSAFTAIADDASSLNWNSAGIGKIRDNSLFFSHSFLYENLASYDSGALCLPLPSDVTIGVGWTRLTIDDIPVYSDTLLINSTVDERLAAASLHLPGTTDEYFSSYDDLYQFAVGVHLGKEANLGWMFFKIPLDLYFGGNIKYIKRKIYDKLGKGNGFDLSSKIVLPTADIFDVSWMGDYSFAVNFQDIGGTAVSWDTASNKEDVILQKTKLGSAYLQNLDFINSEMILSYDINFSYEITRNYGIEYTYDNLVAGRFGLKENDWSVGTSVYAFGTVIDYAFITNSLGNSHRVGMTLKF